MEAKELRVGNIVDKYEYLQNTPYLVFESYIVTGKDLSDTAIFEPIPLTEEWLFKFGFVLYGKEATDSESPRDWYWIKKGFSISIDNITWNTSDIELTLLSVHQLQNLYFALTGEELIIKN